MALQISLPSRSQLDIATWWQKTPEGKERSIVYRLLVSAMFSSAFRRRSWGSVIPSAARR
jgi:hypothetical protein